MMVDVRGMFDGDEAKKKGFTIEEYLRCKVICKNSR